MLRRLLEPNMEAIEVRYGTHEANRVAVRGVDLLGDCRRHLHKDVGRFVDEIGDLGSGRVAVELGADDVFEQKESLRVLGVGQPVVRPDLTLLIQLSAFDSRVRRTESERRPC